MRIAIRFRHTPTCDELENYALRRIGNHLGQFERELHEVAVRVGDVNGPRNGVDMQVVVSVSTKRFGQVVVSALRLEAHEALDAAIKKAARALRKMVDRASTVRPRSALATG